MDTGANCFTCTYEVFFFITIGFVDTPETTACMFRTTNTCSKVKSDCGSNAVSIVNLFQRGCETLAGWSFTAKKQLKEGLIRSNGSSKKSQNASFHHNRRSL